MLIEEPTCRLTYDPLIHGIYDGALASDCLEVRVSHLEMYAASAFGPFSQPPGNAFTEMQQDTVR